MLKRRLLTAFILLPFILLAIWFLPARPFSWVAGALIAWAAWEWSVLAGITHKFARILYVVLILLLFPVARSLELIWLIALVVLWIWAIIGVIIYAKGGAPLGFQYAWIKACFGLFILPGTWLAIILMPYLFKGGRTLLLLGLLIIWAVDIGAYFVGRSTGRRALTKRISPNKTWEGLYGGLGLSILVAIISGFLLHWATPHVIFLIGLSLLTAIFSVFGDLFESMMKRQANVKDSGKALPGHGGILDRIDSMLAGLPLFTLGIMLLNSSH